MHSGVPPPPNLWLVTIGNLKATSKLSIVYYILEVKTMLCGHGDEEFKENQNLNIAKILLQFKQRTIDGWLPLCIFHHSTTLSLSLSLSLLNLLSQTKEVE
jgi:hypothetical protein